MALAPPIRSRPQGPAASLVAAQAGAAGVPRRTHRRLQAEDQPEGAAPPRPREPSGARAMKHHFRCTACSG